ncbi:MAG: hypothetical protein Kow00109_18110 [Acidobacteriota bacterium]
MTEGRRCADQASGAQKELREGAAPRLAVVGAFFVAVLASACCWLPLLLLGLGISAAGLATAVEGWRPVLLPVVFGLLAWAFYLTYRRRSADRLQEVGPAAAQDTVSANLPGGEGEAACCKPGLGARTQLPSWNRVGLWLLAGLALVLAFFPNFSTYLLSFEDQGGGNSTRQVAFSIEGMDCPSCSLFLQKALVGLPEVKEAVVDFETGVARVAVSVDTPEVRKAIAEKVAGAGDYRVRFLEEVRWRLEIDGMTCEACAVTLQERLGRAPGVRSASVRFDRREAMVVADSAVPRQELERVVQEMGFVLKSAERSESR